MVKLIGLCLVFCFAMVAAAVRPSTIGPQNKDDPDEILQDLIAKCKGFVMFPAEPKIKPSEDCCGVVQHVDVPSMCSKVTKEIEKVVCMEKVVYVADECKRPFPPGYQCGSYKVPSMVG